VKYDKLTDKTKQWILDLTGRQLYEKVSLSLKEKKIDVETVKQMYAFWLNQHNLRHDQSFIKIHTPKRDQEGGDTFIIHNIGTPRLYWERYDENISVQTIKNEFQTAWRSYDRDLYGGKYGSTNFA